MNFKTFPKNPADVGEVIAGTVEAHVLEKMRLVGRRVAIELKLSNLSGDLGRSRILDAEESAAYWGVSLPHWRRLYRSGKVPHPIKIGERKLGWRVGDLADALAERLNVSATI